MYQVTASSSFQVQVNTSLGISKDNLKEAYPRIECHVLSRLAGEVRVDGDDETHRKEHEREGDQEETRHGVLACVPSEY